ncbi:FixH family protein [Sphingobacterium sp. SYP-B4668]|uniref:FixH family protein n=1 Tax=Sphingobacterium sp. SYP-B4668 TaxID=2996035 RepID=UPI0022DD3180|nr:FixH family protein [Sphingobacterium sp. SYP-B4668]
MNWGNKIVISLAIFMIGIVCAGIYMVSKNSDTLEEEDYYEKSLHYNDRYDRKANVNKYEAQPHVANIKDTLFIEFRGSQNKGKIMLRRPSNGHLDLDFPFVTSSGIYRLPVTTLTKGMWELGIEWESAGITYFYEKSIFL